MLNDGVLDLTDIDPDRVKVPARDLEPAADPASSPPPVDLRPRCDELTLERDELARRCAALPELTTRLAEAEKALLSIRQARDSVLARNHELIDKLSRADDRIAELGYEREAAEGARLAATQQMEEALRECAELRRKALDLTEQKSAFLEAEKAYLATLAEAREQSATLTAERDIARASVTERVQQIELLEAQLQAAKDHAPGGGQVASELESIRRKLADLEAETDCFKAEQKRNVDGLTLELAAAQGARDAAVSAAHSAPPQLAAGHDSRYARLDEENMVLEAQVVALRAQLENTAPGLDVHRKSPRIEVNALQVQSAAIIEPVFIIGSTPATGRPAADEASVALVAMSGWLQLLRENPANGEVLEEFAEQVRAFAEHARRSGPPALDRFTTAFEELLRWLRKTPARLPGALALAEEAVEILGLLTAIRAPASAPDVEGAVVYAVDQDGDNCECVAMALGKMALRTRYAVKPEIALGHLTANPCDLIILDVEMPGMDDFDFYTGVRMIAHHRSTPVLFSSGRTEARGRLAAIGDPGIGLVAKPYNLTELSLKTLAMILRARLAAAA